MANNVQVKSGVQLWKHNVTEMKQKIMTDVTTTSYTWKKSKNDAATIS